MELLEPGLLAEGDYKITLTGPQGQTFNIATPHRHEREHQPVLLLKGGTDGFRVKPERQARASVNRYGEREYGKRFPPFGGTLKTLVGAPGFKLGHVDRNWRKLWSPFEDTKVTVAATDGGNAFANFRLVDMSDLPHNLRGQPSYPCDVTWTCPDGAWSGPARTYTGAATVIDPSDTGFSAKLTLAWNTAEDLDVTFPAGNRITFKASSISKKLPDTVFFDLEPGMMGRPTDAAGNTLDTLWSAFAGKMRGFELTPHIPTRWALSGCELRVTPRYLHPWR